MSVWKAKQNVGGTGMKFWFGDGNRAHLSLLQPFISTGLEPGVVDAQGRSRFKGFCRRANVRRPGENR